jgi:hypothetical protein
MEKEITKKVSDYAQKNYKMFKGKELFVREGENVFYVSDHKDRSPLILSKSILNK